MDIETGERIGAGETSDRSICSSEEEGSCISQFFSTYDGYSCYEDHIFVNSDSDQYGIPDSPRISAAAVSNCFEGDDDDDDDEMVVVHLEKLVVEKDCRICHLTLDDDHNGNNNSDSGIAIQLGCCCKDDLGAAHKHCAETWFKIKGNTICEICNSIARNVFENETTTVVHQRDVQTAVSSSSLSLPSSSAEDRSCLNGHKLVNFLLACMVFVFLVSWLFHFNIPT
ncbi:uncharacterized protein LOC124940712 [Impatiens glandulifera]|uniref:uncharacterized protein LOC124940712 n=1 Tax=Impatiens glandulifera TaxID=253017 RepID=UPI001FB13AD4|nr:uncharacterized protein LOC124940712 [Impatiens glandulifera]